MSRVVSYSTQDALEIEVLLDGAWRFGTLHEWRRDKAGEWAGWCRINYAQAHNVCGVYPAEQIRRYAYPGDEPPVTPIVDQLDKTT